MKTWQHAAARFGALAIGIGALTITAPHDAPAAEESGDCDFRVEVALTEHLEGVYAPDGWEDQEDIMHQACDFFGADGEAIVYEDGSWVVSDPVTKVWWTGCVSAEAPCADPGM